MTTSAAASSVLALADQIVADDVQGDRPGKAGWVAPPEDGCCSCLPLVVLVCVVVLAVAAVVGYVTGGGTPATVSAAPTADPVPALPQPPDTTTMPANPTYVGPVQVAVAATCNGQPRPFQTPGQLQLGDGRVSLNAVGLPPFTGTVDAGFGVHASGQAGTLTGTLRDGTEQGLSLQTNGVPCAGTFPVGLTLTSPVSVTPTVVQGKPLASTIAEQVATAGPLPDLRGGRRDVAWPLVVGGVAGGAAGLAIAAADVAGRRRRRRAWATTVGVTT